MSHFTVLCIGEDIEKQLYPYYELECSMTREEIKNDPRAEFKIMFTTEDLKKDFEKHLNEHPEYNYESLEDYADDYHGYYKLEDKDEWGYWTNTNSKWDWYEIGGRWTGFFKVKDNPKYPDDIQLGCPGLMTEQAEKGYADSLRKCDIDFEGMRLNKIESLSKTWETIQEKINNGKNHVYALYNIDKNETKESYINKNNGIYTYSVIKDGKWLSKGEMGWFGMSTDNDDNWIENFEKMLESLPDDTLLTVVDCHI